MQRSETELFYLLSFIHSFAHLLARLLVHSIYLSIFRELITSFKHSTHMHMHGLAKIQLVSIQYYTLIYSRMPHAYFLLKNIILTHSLAYYPPFFYSPRFDRRFASLQSYARGSFTQRCTHFTFYIVYTTYIIFNNKTLRARVCLSATLISLRRKQNDLQTSSKNNGRTCVNACVLVWIFVCLFICLLVFFLFFFSHALLEGLLLHKNNDYVFNCYLQLYKKVWSFDINIMLVFILLSFLPLPST